MSKFFIVLVCLAVGLVGLFMSACGGFFLIADLAEGGHMGIWVIALPATAAGMVFVWAGIKGIRKVRQDAQNQ